MCAATAVAAVICLTSVFPLDAIDFNKLHAHTRTRARICIGSESKAIALIWGKRESSGGKEKNRIENTMNGNDSVMLLTSFGTHAISRRHSHSHTHTDNNDSFHSDVAAPGIVAGAAAANVINSSLNVNMRTKFREKPIQSKFRWLRWQVKRNSIDASSESWFFYA